MRLGGLRSHDATRLAPWLAALAILCALPRVAGAEGPWSARVVDAQTGSALEGVVVVSFWYGPPAQFSSPLGMPGLVAVEEVVTDQQGRVHAPGARAPRRAAFGMPRRGSFFLKRADGIIDLDGSTTSAGRFQNHIVVSHL
jgi:hypothetical protein